MTEACLRQQAPVGREDDAVIVSGGDRDVARLPEEREAASAMTQVIGISARAVP